MIQTPSKKEILDLADELNNVPVEKFYSDHGTEKFHRQVGEINKAIEKGDYQLALRISNFYKSQFTEIDVLGGSKEEDFADVPNLKNKFSSLTDMIEECGAVSIHSGIKGCPIREMKIVSSKADITKMAKAVDICGKYFSSKIWVSPVRGTNFAYLEPWFLPGSASAIVKTEPDSSIFNIELIEKPLNENFDSDLLDYLKLHTN